MAHISRKSLGILLIVGILINIAVSSPLFGETNDFAPLVGDLVPADSGVHAQAGNRGCNGGGRPGGPPGGPGGPPPATTTTTASSG